ncbi:hypothetical protein ACFQOZ_04390 [Comamonas endophytica]
MQWVSQALRQQWSIQVHELHLFLEIHAREAVLEQAHYYCTGLAGWATRSIFERIEHMHLPPGLKLLVTTTVLHQTQVFCGALVNQLHDQTQALFNGIQQILHGEKPLPAAALQPAMEKSATQAVALEPSGKLPESAGDAPAQATASVDLVGNWDMNAGAPLL